MHPDIFNLDGKVALVTGGNSGIGLAIAKALASAGSNVVIWGTNTDKNKQALADLRSFGIESIAQEIDVSDEDQVRAGIGHIISRFGCIDTVVANAGISEMVPSFLELPTDKYRRMLAVNVDGVFFTLREALKNMVAQVKGGRAPGSVIVTSSIGSIHGPGRCEHYGASKAAVSSMMRGVAVEFAQYGIRANAIVPGWISTAMTAELEAYDKFKNQVISRIPMRRLGNPEDVAGITIYLASDASRYHTGDTFVIDGGYTVF